MRTHVKKLGNSAAVRLPAAVLEAAQLQPVDVYVEGNCIVIDAIRGPEYDLRTLVAGIAPENLHEETDWGPPVGRELK
jgi:antitoxin MazE